MKSKTVGRKRFDHPYVVTVRLAFTEGTTRKARSSFGRRLQGVFHRFQEHPSTPKEPRPS